MSGPRIVMLVAALVLINAMGLWALDRLGILQVRLDFEAEPAR